MFLLILTSFIWAFSFGIIKTALPGVDASLTSFLRLVLPFFFFAPFLRLKGIPKANIAKLILLGAVQYGLMYLAYIHSFRYLKAYQVAFFTVFTPWLVTFFNDFLDRKFRPLFFVTAGLAVLGTGIIVYKEFPLAGFSTGFWLVQASNACFAVGQVLYRRGFGRGTAKDLDVFGLLYLGAALVTLVPAGMALRWNLPVLTTTQAGALLYLGLVASGLGFFFWNVGAKSVNAGALAILNNLKVPLAAFVSIFVFREQADLIRVALGTAFILGALYLNENMNREKR